jgi:spermidine/putrescine transport system ATP-binding protein
MECGDSMIKLKVDNFKTPIYVTDYKSSGIGERELYTIRPEKIHISLQKPSISKYSNIFTGVVEEPIYAGFQSKLYVRLENGELLKVYKQNIKFLDDGPEINFEDNVYVSWRAGDGYLIKDTLNEK